jgi:hypothetical protein
MKILNLHNEELHICTHTHYCAGDKNEYEMCGVYRSDGGGERRVQGFVGET